MRTKLCSASGIVTTVIAAAALISGPAHAAPAATDLPVVAAQLPAGSPTAAAAQAINASAKSIAGPDLPGLLTQLGVQPFLYPTGAPFCTDGGGLGLAPAMAGAIPGPWPKVNLPFPLPFDTNAVKPGQVLYAFVPSGVTDGPDKSGMHVAWFNVNTFQGGLVPMGTITDVVNSVIPPEVPPLVRGMIADALKQYFGSVIPQGGVRAVPVATGSGTVLAAVFGTVSNGAKSCFFLPTVGLTQVP